MMAAHVHLFLNHVPILGVIFAGILFAVALRLRSVQFQRVSLALLVVFALAAIPVYFTGEPAEETIEKAPGVSEAAIERHEDAAGVAFAAMEVLGAVALGGLALFRRSSALPRVFATAVLAMAVTTGGLFTWTGYLGGQIRHPEIQSSASLAGGGADQTTSLASGQSGERRRNHDDD